jgi:2-dehydropantoate 2-reductase
MGPGGVGGYFGARLAAAGSDVTFVARGAHLDAMRKTDCASTRDQALHLEAVKVWPTGRGAGRRHSSCSPSRCATPKAPPNVCGLWWPRARRFHLPERRGERRAGRPHLGAANVVPGVARIGSHLAPGVIKQIGTFCRLEFGERDGKPSARTTAFRRRKPPAEPSSEEHRARGVDEVRHAGAALRHDGADAGHIGPVRANRSRGAAGGSHQETVAVGVALETGLTPADTGDLLKLVGASEAMASMAHDLWPASRSRSTVCPARWRGSAGSAACRRPPTPSSPRRSPPSPTASPDVM